MTWVFKVKYGNDGNVECFKACVVMPKSIYSIDYKETFSPAVQFKICIISILLVSHPHVQQKQRQVIIDCL